MNTPTPTHSLLIPSGSLAEMLKFVEEKLGRSTSGVATFAFGRAIWASNDVVVSQDRTTIAHFPGGRCPREWIGLSRILPNLRRQVEEIATAPSRTRAAEQARQRAEKLCGSFHAADGSRIKDLYALTAVERFEVELTLEAELGRKAIAYELIAAEKKARAEKQLRIEAANRAKKELEGKALAAKAVAKKEAAKKPAKADKKSAKGKKAA